jgi:hypothetical protein
MTPPGPDTTDSTIEQDATFECIVRLPGWRIHVADMMLSEGRDLGNVMNVAVKGALDHLLRCHRDGKLEESRTILAIRESLRRIGIDPTETPPCTESLIWSFLRNKEIPRGSLAWEFLAVLTAKSHAPWSALCRDDLHPPLVFRRGEPGESIPTPDGTFECEGLPVLADQDGIKASPWTHGAPEDLEGCDEPVFVCYVPEELFRKIEPKSHMGRAVWLTWAYRFRFERTCSYRTSTA